VYKGKKILGIIPARGGSKGIPGKNIKNLNGQPLISYTINAARKAKYLSRTIVSTDSREISSIAKEYGAEVPFLRPGNISEDNSPSSATVIHALDYYRELGTNYDYIALLEPTSPLRKNDDIDNAIVRLINNSSADSLVSVGEVHMEHPMIIKKIVSGFVSSYIDNLKMIHQRQQADVAYFPYGVIYLAKVNVFRDEKSFYLKKTIPFLIERWQNYEIDDLVDFEIAQLLFSKYL
jgi:CMP-N,N'-diacetyllegionaminic acid synthase